MILFWFLALVIAFISAYIIIRPVLKPDAIKEKNNDELRVSIYRENLKEVESELNSGELDAGQLENVKNELELSLLQEKKYVTNSPEYRLQRESHPGITTIALTLAIVILSFYIYSVLGNPQLIELIQLTDETVSEDQGNVGSIDQVIILLERHLERNPDDANSHYYLANAYSSKSDFENAVSTFEHLYQLTGDNTQVMLAYVDALVRLNDGSFAGRPFDLLKRILSIEPDNYAALLFSGFAADELGDLKTANNFYTKLLPVLQDNPELLQTVNMLIAKNELLLPDSGSVEENSESGSISPPDPARSVLINVSVSDQLLEKFSPEDTLFIYAQALEGMPMPLAVIRTRADELPMEVTLDDSMAMVPTHKISDFDMVKIQARISQSGDAEVSSGDIVGLINEVSVADTGVINLVISEIIP